MSLTVKGPMKRVRRFHIGDLVQYKAHIIGDDRVFEVQTIVMGAREGTRYGLSLKGTKPIVMSAFHHSLRPFGENVNIASWRRWIANEYEWTHVQALWTEYKLWFKVEDETRHTREVIVGKILDTEPVKELLRFLNTHG